MLRAEGIERYEVAVRGLGLELKIMMKTKMGLRCDSFPTEAMTQISRVLRSPSNLSFRLTFGFHSTIHSMVLEALSHDVGGDVCDWPTLTIEARKGKA
jgi:hypothetical protein